MTSFLLVNVITNTYKNSRKRIIVTLRLGKCRSNKEREILEPNRTFKLLINPIFTGPDDLSFEYKLYIKIKTIIITVIKKPVTLVDIDKITENEIDIM